MSKDARSTITPRLPRGLVDHAAGDLAVRDAMLAKIRAVYERYGFEPVETPMIEYTDALGKFLPDQDRPNEGVFSFQDDDEQWLSLRYDLTAPLARFVAEQFDKLPKPYRSYRAGYVFRNEKPGPGRFRQFMQFDADTVGAASVAADAEICMMAADAMEALGIACGDYVIRVNNRKVLDGVMEAADIPTEKHLAVLRAIDKLDRVGTDGVRLLFGKGRKDESGDFTKGAELGDEQTEFLIGYLSNEAMHPSSQKYAEGHAELTSIEEQVRAAGYGEDRIRIDPSVVRGLEYYTGPVFEAELLFETVNEKGEKARFGSVGGGGRYDGLVGRFRKENVPATGFSIGVSRLQAALAALGKLDAGIQQGPVVVTVMDRDRIADYQRMTAALRNAGIAAEMFLGNPRQFGKQLQYADRRNSPLVVIQGGDEHAKGEVTLKDLIAGAEAAKSIADHKTWVEQRPAQVTVPEAELVERVKAMLAAQRGEAQS